MGEIHNFKRWLSMLMRAAEASPVAGDVLNYQGPNQVQWVAPAGLPVDHGGLVGLADDDHTQYLKEEASGGLASETPDHTHVDATECGTVDHGDLAGLIDDDHPNYLIHRANMCRVYHNAAQNVNNNTITTMAFNQERFDPGNIHDTVTNNSRITPGVAGTFLFGTNLQYATDAGGNGCRDILMDLNGGGVYIAHIRQQACTNSDSLNCNCVWRTTNAADYVEIDAYQTSGGALNVNATLNRSPEFWSVRFQ